ncbi:MAG: ATPase [Bacteroidia bacterium]|nr:ATPase [Bacteroidia bacterium]
MILIADSGSTKTDWRIIKNGIQHFITHTIGLNPYQVSEAIVAQTIAIAFDSIDEKEVSAIYFYGTGCSTVEKKKFMHDCLQQYFKSAQIYIDHDLMAAARALCGDAEGVACILGTGSNSCMYNGTVITRNVTSLGYILGDEGSGSYMGKLFLKKYMSKSFNENINNAFLAQYNYTTEDLLNEIYKKPFPNRFLAQFAQFIHTHLDEPVLKNIVQQGFQEFVDTQLGFYPIKNQKIHFTGSIAYNFKAELAQCLLNNNYELGTVSASPTDSLVQYHLNL